MKYLTRQAEQDREAVLIERYLEQGMTLNQAENAAEADVQVEQYGSTHEDANDRKYAYRVD